MDQKQSIKEKIQARKEREKAEMREKIILAARKMFSEMGYEAVSIRNIASAISYSPATIYNYFKSIDEIFYAIHDEAFTVFHKKLKANEVIPDPMERLRHMGITYVEFALENPEYYDLMFILKAPMQCIQVTESWDCGMKAYRCLEETIQECIQQGHFQDKNIHAITLGIWSFVHGLASLAVRDRLRMYPDEHRQTLIMQAIDHMTDMFK